MPGIASISKTSGDPILTVNTPKDLYPVEAFKEALRLTAGMPYSKRGQAKVQKETQAVVDAAPEPEEEVTPDDPVVDSRDYQKVVAKYTDKNGATQYSTKVVVAHIDLLERKEQAQAVDTPAPAPNFQTMDDDDIPF